MTQPDTLIHGRWIAPVEPRDTLLEQHAIAIGSGRILALLPSAEARQRYPDATAIERPHHLLIPGLVNAHTHAAMSLLRGLADDLPLMRWLNEHIWPAEAQQMSPAFVESGSKLAMAEMIRSGTSCFNDMYFFPDVTARVAAAAGMRAVVGLIVIDFPSAWASDPATYLQRGEALWHHYRDHPLIRCALAPHAPYSVSDAPLQQVAVTADRLDLPIHIHLHETADEIAGSLRAHGERPIARLQRLGLLNRRLLAVHMTQLEAAEIALCAEQQVQVVHCPESNLKLASGFCPITQLLDAGVNCALGSDGAASNNDLDLIGEMRTAALLAKGVSGDASALPAAQALELATLGGAKALGLDQEIGSLRPGKSADIAAIDLQRLETQPLYHPLSQLIYASSRDQVSDLWVAGRQLLRERQLTTLDLPQLLADATAWQPRIRPFD